MCQCGLSLISPDNGHDVNSYKTCTCVKTCPYIAEPTSSAAELPLILALITTARNGDWQLEISAVHQDGEYVASSNTLCITPECVQFQASGG